MCAHVFRYQENIIQKTHTNSYKQEVGELWEFFRAGKREKKVHFSCSDLNEKSSVGHFVIRQNLGWLDSVISKLLVFLVILAFLGLSSYFSFSEISVNQNDSGTLYF